MRRVWTDMTEWLRSVWARLTCLRKGHDWRTFGDAKGGLRLCRRCPAVESLRDYRGDPW